MDNFGEASYAFNSGHSKTNLIAYGDSLIISMQLSSGFKLLRHDQSVARGQVGSDRLHWLNHSSPTADRRFEGPLGAPRQPDAEQSLA